MTATPSPVRGEVWDVDFDPSVGAEIKKTRPAVVVSISAVGRLALRIIVPITEWDAKYAMFPWLVNLKPTRLNGLTKESGADAFQIKSVALARFVRKLGVLLPSEMDEIAAAVAVCIDA
jgi:mRNA interferase MazF